ncbi:MAG: Proline--tRNA ligase [Microgenomates bacterium OLB22]|nr:MAG: Proline--tRNA ligase [Microgenomates bacterium OLB22]
MRLSKDIIKVIQDKDLEFDSISHELLVRTGYVDQVASGIYTWLTPGLRVIEKIEKIIREELDALGSLEIAMPSLHPASLWQQSGRWDSVDVLYKLKSRYGDKDYVLGASHEEIVTPLATKYIKSYRDLPLSLYQIGTKYRDEARAKSGVLRGMEFRMKDMYSFHDSQEDLDRYYQKVKEAYLQIFRRIGLDDVKVTEASGGDFSKKHSHEFTVLTPAGEVEIVYCESCSFAQNHEVVSKALESCPDCGDSVKTGKAIEIANIFDLGTSFSKNFELTYTNDKGTNKPVYMGCYGIGITRLVGAVVELHNDDEGIAWPESVAPYHVHLANLTAKTTPFGDLVYRTLQAEGITVLYDDREQVSPGEKIDSIRSDGTPAAPDRVGAQWGYDRAQRTQWRTYPQATLARRSYKAKRIFLELIWGFVYLR